MQKNDLVTVAIEDIGVGGEGIGKVDGYTLFIKDAIIGDVVEAKIVKAKKNYGYARLMNIVTPSENRVEKPACPMARRCGGCQIQEMKYGAQLAFKEGKVRGNLERIGEVPTELLDKVMQPIVGMEEPFHYRNKAQFPIGTDKEGHIITGFYAGRTHSIIPNTDCALGVAVNQKILEIILHFMENNHISAYDEEKHKGLVRHVLIRYGFKTDEIMVCLVMNGEKLPHAEKLVDKLCKISGMTSITISVNKAKTNVIMGNEIKLLWGQTYITDYIGNVKYQISPLSFYQVNPVQTEKLYGLALDYADLNGNGTVWDLYCGIGTISLFLAQKAKQVYGVEIVPQAIDDARNNAKINDITNAEFYVGKAEEVLPEYYKEYEKTGRVVFFEDHNCMELKGIISKCRFFVGARTHSTIAAYSMGIPTLVVGYSVKARGIARDLFGGEEGYVLPVQKLTRDKLISAFKNIMIKEKEIQKKLKKDNYKQQIYTELKRGMI